MSAPRVSTTWLSVQPLDTVMVRDGRGFDAGVAATAAAALPAPSTLGGAVAEALGRDVDGHLVGPIMATDADGPVFPVPQDIVTSEDGQMRRLAPRPLMAGERCDLEGRLSHLLSGGGAPVGGFFTADAMSEWLAGDGELVAGQDVDAGWWQQHEAGEVWHEEQRIGLTLRRDGQYAGTAQPGMLYAMTHLRPAEHARFLVGCADRGAIHVVKDLVPLGGRGRLAAVAESADQLVLPDPPGSFPDGRVAVYLATPALLDNVCWAPPGATLCAVAVAGAQPVATASPRDMWRTRLLSWAAPAGTVFYLDFGGDAAATRWAHDHHGRLLPQQRDLRLVTAGFGTCLMGRWNA